MGELFLPASFQQRGWSVPLQGSRRGWIPAALRIPTCRSRCHDVRCHVPIFEDQAPPISVAMACGSADTPAPLKCFSCWAVAGGVCGCVGLLPRRAHARVSVRRGLSHASARARRSLLSRPRAQDHRRHRRPRRLLVLLLVLGGRMPRDHYPHRGHHLGVLWVLIDLLRHEVQDVHGRLFVHRGGVGVPRRHPACDSVLVLP